MMRRIFALVVPGLFAIACSSSNTNVNGDNGGGGGGDDGGGAADGGPGANAEGGAGGDSGNIVGTGAGDAVDLGKGMPQLIVGSKTQGVLATPKIVAVTYDTDTNRADLEAFLPAFAASKAWASTTSEYGVGPLTVSTPIHLTGSAPSAMKDSDIHTLLKNQGALDANTIYTFFLPKGTIIDDGSGSKCCTDYDGYHGSYSTGGVNAVYSIVCSCPGFDGMNVTDLQQITVAASHEAVEASTDPYDKPAGFYEPDDNHIAWSLVTGGETADMCSFADTTYWIPSDMKYMVQRSWSNAAAAAGHDPCVGEATTPYYQAIPELNDTVTLTDYQVTTKSIKIAKGATGTLKLRLYADTSDAGQFTVQVDDYSQMGYIKTKNPSGTFKSGDEVSVDITVVGADPNYTNAEVFQVTTTPASGKGPATYYWGLVSQ